MNNAAFIHRRVVYAARQMNLHEPRCHRSTADSSLDGDTVDAEPPSSDQK